MYMWNSLNGFRLPINHGISATTETRPLFVLITVQGLLPITNRAENDFSKEHATSTFNQNNIVRFFGDVKLVEAESTILHKITVCACTFLAQPPK